MDESLDSRPRGIRQHGTASDDGHVYQSGRDQTVTHLHMHVGSAEGVGRAGEIEGRVTPQAAQQHAQRVIEGLALAVEHYRRRCAELAEEARRARNEGRREALYEVQEKLRDAELRVIRAQEKKREAERERERLESLLARTIYEEEAARRQPLWDPPDDARAFERILAAADDELSVVRDELRILADGLQKGSQSGDDDTVVAGEVVSEPETRRSPMKRGAGYGATPSTPGRTLANVQPGRVRRYSGRLLFVIAALPMPVAGTGVRLTYSQEPAVAIIWRILFPVVAILLVAGVVCLLNILARLAYGRKKDDGATVLGCSFHFLLGIVTFVVCIILSPSAVPLLSDWGRLFAEYVGPL